MDVNRLGPFGWLLILAGIGAYAFYMYAHSIDTAGKNWPTTDAVIETCKIVKTQRAYLKTSLTSTAPYRDPRYDSVDVWAVDVEYAYKVDGEDFEGNDATSNSYVEKQEPGETHAGPGIGDIAAKLPAGGKVPVHYNSQHPSESYLLYMESPGNEATLITAWVFFGLGALLVAAPLFAKRTTQPSQHS